MRSRPLLLSSALLVSTVAAGSAVRFAHLSLPASIPKYGGSMLWALTIYWLISTLLPKLPLTAAALLAAVIATVIEFLKLYHAPVLDAFRLTLPGILLLGRFFSAWDILAYWFAIATGAMIDQRLRA